MNTTERLTELLETYRTKPIEPLADMTFNVSVSPPKPKGSTILPSPSRLGKHPLILQLYRLGFTYPEPLTAFAYLNITRGLTLEMPVLNLLKSVLPNSQTQVKLEHGGIRGYADLITEDGEVLDVKCSNTQSWHSNPAYRKQLVWYSQVKNGCNMDAFLLNYTGDLEVKVIKAASMAKTWLVLNQTLREIFAVSVIQDVFSLDNIHWVSLPKILPADKAWQVGGMDPYHKFIYRDSRRVSPEQAIDNLLGDFND